MPNNRPKADPFGPEQIAEHVAIMKRILAEHAGFTPDTLLTTTAIASTLDGQDLGLRVIEVGETYGPLLGLSSDRRRVKRELRKQSLATGYSRRDAHSQT